MPYFWWCICAFNAFTTSNTATYRAYYTDLFLLKKLITTFILVHLNDFRTESASMINVIL